MRAGPSDEVLTGVCQWEPVVSSWRGADLLAAQIPVSSGRLVWDATQDVPERLTMTVPRMDAGVDWRPGADPYHPLARFGQELDVSIRVTSTVRPSDTWLVRVARILVTGWSDDDDQEVTVTGRGVLHRMVRSRLTSPIQPTGTLASTARRLLPAGMGMAIDPALPDRAVPSGMAWSGSRREALAELAEAWPALVRTDEWGQVRLRAPLPDVPAPVHVLRDGEGGTLVSAPRSDEGDQAYNEVVARSSAPDMDDIQALARHVTGPLSADGPNGPNTKEWSSPLITSYAMALASARTMLANSLRPASVLPITCASDPRIELDDALEIWRDGERTWGYVTGVDLPLTVDDGDMRLNVSTEGA